MENHLECQKRVLLLLSRRSKVIILSTHNCQMNKYTCTCNIANILNMFYLQLKLSVESRHDTKHKMFLFSSGTTVGSFHGCMSYRCVSARLIMNICIDIIFIWQQTSSRDWNCSNSNTCTNRQWDGGNDRATQHQG